MYFRLKKLIKVGKKVPSYQSIKKNYLFSSQSRDSCLLNKKNFETLKNHLEQNLEKVAFFTNQLGPNYLSCVFENCLNLGVGSPDFYGRLASRLIKKEIDDPFVLKSLFSGT